MKARGLRALLCALALLLPALLAGCEQATDSDDGDGNPALTGTVTVNGDARVGETLTANVSALGGEGTVSYQWQRGGTGRRREASRPLRKQKGQVIPLRPRMKGSTSG
jgi:hypothetical protein